MTQFLTPRIKTTNGEYRCISLQFNSVYNIGSVCMRCYGSTWIKKMTSVKSCTRNVFFELIFEGWIEVENNNKYLNHHMLIIFTYILLKQMPETWPLGQEHWHRLFPALSGGLSLPQKSGCIFHRVISHKLITLVHSWGLATKRSHNIVPKVITFILQNIMLLLFESQVIHSNFKKEQLTSIETEKKCLQRKQSKHFPAMLVILNFILIQFNTLAILLWPDVNMSPNVHLVLFFHGSARLVLVDISFFFWTYMHKCSSV